MNSTAHTPTARRATRPTEAQIRTNIREKETSTKYVFKSCIQKNIVVMGRTRSGKTTFVEVIKDLKHTPPTLQLYSGTKAIDIRHIATTINQTDSECTYNINVIDTPGFYDIGSTANGASSKKLSNANIKMLIDKCMTQQVTQIHVFAFVFSVENGINSEDVESMKFVQDNYPQLKPYLALILTHCEDKDEEATQALIEEFFNDSRVKNYDLRNYFSLGVHCMGCIDPQHVKNGLNETVNFEIENVEFMREAFLDFLVGRNNFYNIHNDSGCSIL